jgi:hypothetical protein
LSEPANIVSAWETAIANREEIAMALLSQTWSMDARHHLAELGVAPDVIG